MPELRSPTRSLSECFLLCLFDEEAWNFYTGQLLLEVDIVRPIV